jgi:uncharacterized membrane protein
MAALHPQIVHFTIVLAIVGVAFRIVSLFGRPAFASPAAATLLILAAAFSVVSVRSGTAAHGPVERAPGARPAVVEHEEWGERTQAVLLTLGAIELLGLALSRSPKVKLVRAAAAVVGVVAVFSVYETAEHGGDLVYAYAGGVGIRSGDPKDVERLLLAGYYHQALADRKAGRAEAAADLVAAAARRFPSDPEVQLLAAESMLLDRKDPRSALEVLTQVQVPENSRAMRVQRAMLQADAHEAVGQKDAAIAALEPILEAFPNARVKQRLDALKSGASERIKN